MPALLENRVAQEIGLVRLPETIVLFKMGFGFKGRFFRVSPF